MPNINSSFTISRLCPMDLDKNLLLSSYNVSLNLIKSYLSTPREVILGPALNWIDVDWRPPLIEWLSGDSKSLTRPIICGISVFWSFNPKQGTSTYSYFWMFEARMPFMSVRTICDRHACLPFGVLLASSSTLDFEMIIICLLLSINGTTINSFSLQYIMFCFSLCVLTGILVDMYE